jgi:hypothetical protein
MLGKLSIDFGPTLSIDFGPTLLLARPMIRALLKLFSWLVSLRKFLHWGLLLLLRLYLILCEPV